MEESNEFRVCAGIVTFNPVIKLLRQNIESICKQVKNVIIVDNGSKNIYDIEQLTKEEKNVYLIKNKLNGGISKALNQIFSWATNSNYNWVLTLDQDSVCENNMIEIFSMYIGYNNIGVICPRIDYYNYKRKKNISNSEIDYVEACMTSASLTSVLAWKDSGGYDEWMFIDYVDNDFCMRLKLNGYRIARINKAVLHHNLGSAETKKIGPFEITVFNHSSVRNYYYVRNSIYFIRKYRRHISLFKYILILIYWEGKKVLFESKRLKTLSSFFRGLKDGVRAEI